MAIPESLQVPHWPSLLLIVGVPLAFLVIFWLVFKRPFIKSLKDKHVFITGGSTGIGLSIAKRALLDGAYVTLVSRSVQNLSSAVEDLVKEVQCSTERIRYEAADVGDPEAVACAVANANAWRDIDVLICNAGLTRGGYMGDATLRDYEITVNTNLMGVIHVLHSAMPIVKSRSQSHPVSIVIMGSLASLFFMYGHAVYTATKYAVRGLAEGLRFELLPYKNIRVSLICPGFTTTSFLDDAEKEQDITKLLKYVNLYSRRLADSPEWVAYHTIGAVKSGAAMVTTNALGLVLATLGRGFAHSDSYPLVIFELVMFLPFRISSLIIIPFFQFILSHRKTSPTGISPN